MRLYQGDCVEIIKSIPAASVDCVITDPPYPMIKRGYGMMTEAAWFGMMKALVPEVRRVLKPQGSAVFILQPNSHKIGSMRAWLWRFMAWLCDEWNIVQDAYWWNTSAMPEAHAIQGRLMRPSTKYLIWCGEPDCYRNQDAVLWDESEANKAERLAQRHGRRTWASGQASDKARQSEAAVRRGGVTPFNVLPIPNARALGPDMKHPAMTPLLLADWWTRYICPPDGTVLDCFMGSGTMGLAAIRNECGFIGIEKMEKYYEVAKARIEQEQSKPRTVKMELVS